MSSAAASNRAGTYTLRIGQARGDRDRMNALVGWLMAEFYRLPAQAKDVEYERVVSLAREWNARSGS